MHNISNEENDKRGCLYCFDRTKVYYQDNNGRKVSRYVCSHDKCPYRELDKHERYKDYLKEVVKEFDILDTIRK